VRALGLYAAASLGVVAVGAGLAALLLEPATARAVWFAGGIAWVVQVAAFAGMLAVRGRNELFLMGWLLGLALRFMAVGLVAFWLTRDPVLPLAPALLSLVAFVFVLLLLEPMFLRRGLQTR
jgi:CHASE2 domain-containing sensor protein